MLESKSTTWLPLNPPVEPSDDGEFPMPVKTPEEIGNHFIKEVWISTGIELELSQGGKQLPSWGLCDDPCCVANERQALCNTSYLIHAAGPREARRGPWTWVSSCAAGWDCGDID